MHLCSSLSAAVRESRARRAWNAGLSASLVLGGETNYVDATPKLDIKNRLYVVLRHPGGEPPAVYSTFAAFKRAVGHLPGSQTVCHGFPTEEEARLFCLAAGQAYPQLQK